MTQGDAVTGVVAGWAEQDAQRAVHEMSAAERWERRQREEADRLLAKCQRDVADVISDWGTLHQQQPNQPEENGRMTTKEDIEALHRAMTSEAGSEEEVLATTIRVAERDRLDRFTMAALTGIASPHGRYEDEPGHSRSCAAKAISLARETVRQLDDAAGDGREPEALGDIYVRGAKALQGVSSGHVDRSMDIPSRSGPVVSVGQLIDSVVSTQNIWKTADHYDLDVSFLRRIIVDLHPWPTFRQEAGEYAIAELERSEEA